MKLKRRGVWLAAVSAVLLVCLCGFSAAAAEKSADRGVVFDGSVSYRESYALGEQIVIERMAAHREGTQLPVSAVLQRNGRVKAVLESGAEAVRYRFKETGEHSLIYRARVGEAFVTRTFVFDVEKRAYFENSLRRNYALGDTVITRAEAVSGSVRAAAGAEVLGPLGEVDASAGYFLPDCAGDYTVKLTATVGGERLEQSFALRVTNGAAEDLIRSVSGVKSLRADVDAPYFNQPGKGVEVLAGGTNARFRFANRVDLNALAKNRNLIRILPLSTGSYSLLNDFYVRLVDAHDERNAVEFYCYPVYYGTGEDWSYVFCNYDGRNLARANWGDGSVKTVGDGAITSVHFDGDRSLFQEGCSWLEIQSDYAEKRFYVTGGAANNTYQWLLLDLDDPSNVGVGKEWKGFTTGEVYLEVEMNALGANSGVLLGEVAGQSLGGARVKDTVGPSILLETGKRGLPSGEVGTPYPLPRVTGVLDTVDGRLDAQTVTIALKRKFIEEGFVRYADVTNLLEDGAFVPEEGGEYLAQYTVRDASGNESERNEAFTVRESLGTLRAVCRPDDTAWVGTEYELPDVTAEGMSTLTLREVVYSYNGKVLNAAAGDAVFLDQAGTLTVRYAFRDYLGRRLEGSVPIDVKVKNAAILSVPGMPVSAIKGRELILPDFTAVNYGKPEAERYPERSVTVNGRSVDLRDPRYAVTEPGGSTLRVVYAAGGEELVFDVPVIDPVYLSDYFLTEGGGVSFENNEDYTALIAASDAVFTLANPLVVTGSDGVRINLAPDPGRRGFGYLDVVLRDYDRPGREIFFRVEQVHGGYTVRVNGVGPALPLAHDPETGLTLRYDDIKSQLTGLAVIDRDASGRRFSGFESGMAVLSLRFGDVSGEAAIRVRQIMNKRFQSQFLDGALQPYVDFGMPTLCFDGSVYDGEPAIGGELAIPAVQAWTELSGRCRATVTVIGPDGGVRLENADAARAHRVRIDAYGSWKVVYRAEYAGGLFRTYTQIVAVRKERPPEFTLNGDLAAEYAAGGSVRVPEIAEQDGAKGYAFITDPDGRFHAVEFGAEFVLQKKGGYRLTVVVSDAFNSAVRYFAFRAV